MTTSIDRLAYGEATTTGHEGGAEDGIVSSADWTDGTRGTACVDKEIVYATRAIFYSHRSTAHGRM